MVGITVLFFTYGSPTFANRQKEIENVLRRIERAVCTSLEGNEGPFAAVNRVVKAANLPKNSPWTARQQLAMDLAKAIFDSREQSGVEAALKDRHQYFTIRTQILDQALSAISLNGKTVLEFGAGTGILTSRIEGAGPGRIFTWEIDPVAALALQHTTNPNLTKVSRASFTEVKDWEKLLKLAGGPKNTVVISNPPYFTLPAIKQIIDSNRLLDVLLYIPKKQLKSDFKPENGWCILGYPSTEDFYPRTRNPRQEGSPETNSTHVVVGHGLFCRNL